MTNSRTWVLGLWFFVSVVFAMAPLQTTWAESEQAAPAINNPNPGADLWRAVRGHLDSPAVTQVKGHDSAVLVNDEGERWTLIRVNELVPKSRDWLLFVILLLGLVYMIAGPQKLQHGEAGVEVERHNTTARFIHWFLAIIFIVLGITGLILLLGRVALIPLIGKEAFGVVARICKEVHNFVGPLFPVAIILVFFNLVRGNLYERGDIKWILKGGGFFSEGHVSAGKFNPGEKLLFWLTIFLGIGVSVTGYILDFPTIAAWIVSASPDFSQYRHVMELSHVLHTIIAIVFIAFILGHIFLATMLVPGTLQGMTSGKVDANWAKEHHDRWYAEIREGENQKS
ncbi:MAG: formate dehydrogenase subunit gamma [Acidiferrobacter sp.]|nr:formate dehydrogenase subunit gamma [Acidiferrobacter sp.]